VNHKRVYRLHKQAGLNLRSKRPRRRKAAAHHRTERPLLTAPAQFAERYLNPTTPGSPL